MTGWASFFVSGSAKMKESAVSEFINVCSVEDLVSGAGVAALVNEQQIALFYIGGNVYALDNFEPIGEAFVLSRGMTGDAGGELFVASPLHKERFSLLSGECLDCDGVSVAVYPSKIEDGQVWISA